MTTTRAHGEAARDDGPSAGRPSGRMLASYAAGSVGTGAFSTLPGLVLAYYLTDSIG
ncbi:MAG: MFS transporter, partial [Dietzia sp.]|nr:MFS transporter [Dietzia sp.]